MPSIDVAMARSLHGGLWGTLKDSLVRSVATNLMRRGVVGETKDKVTDVATAFSSWDNCMKADFCKWPIIGIIVIGGLIIFSVAWCIIRCCCCGLSCCCSCFQCLKCCGDCCGCCDPPGGRRHKHLDDPYEPTNHASHAYRSEPPMNATFPAVSSKPYNEPPQYAEFDVSKKEGEDSLPRMPSWEGSGSKKVFVEGEAVEMSDLKKSPTIEQPVVAMHAPASRAGSVPQGRSPYAQPQGSSSGYLTGGAQQPESYSPIDQGYGYHAPSADGYGMDQSYGAMGAGAVGPGRRSPAQAQSPMDQGYGQMGSQQDPYGNYDGYARGPSPGAPQGYGMPRAGTGEGSRDAYGMYGTEPRMRQSPGPRQTPGPRRTPGPPADYAYNQPPRRSPAPQNDYGYNQPGYGAPTDRTYSPAPERQYANQSPGPRQLTRPPPAQYVEEPPRSPIVNNSGFDFNSGNSRPQQSPTQESYPGYKPYQPS